MMLLSFHRFLAGVAMLAFAIATAHAQEPEPTVIQLDAAQPIHGTITGYQQAVYAFDVTGGAVDIALQAPKGLSLYHNVVSPAGETLFTGSIEGARYQAALREPGRYKVVVYLMRNDARRGKRAAFTLTARHAREAGNADAQGAGKAVSH